MSFIFSTSFGNQGYIPSAGSIFILDAILTAWPVPFKVFIKSGAAAAPAINPKKPRLPILGPPPPDHPSLPPSAAPPLAPISSIIVLCSSDIAGTGCCCIFSLAVKFLKIILFSSDSSL